MELKLHFWLCAKTPNVPEFEKNMEQMKVIDEKAHDRLLELYDPHHWSQAFFSTDASCDVVDNNMCEAFNSVLVEPRRRPIITMLEAIRNYVMVRLQQKRDEALQKWKHDYAPRVLMKLEKIRSDATKWDVSWNGHVMYEVKLGLDQFVVNL